MYSTGEALLKQGFTKGKSRGGCYSEINPPFLLEINGDNVVGGIHKKINQYSVVKEQGKQNLWTLLDTKEQNF